LPHVCVEPSLCHQLVVSAVLYNFAVRKDKDPASKAGRAAAIRRPNVLKDHRTPLPPRPQSTLLRGTSSQRIAPADEAAQRSTAALRSLLSRNFPLRFENRHDDRQPRDVCSASPKRISIRR